MAPAVPPPSRRGQATPPVPHAPRSLADLRAAEVYVQTLTERLTLTLAHGETERVERLAPELAAVRAACAALDEAVRPALRRLDPTMVNDVEAAADLARQRVEAAVWG